MKITIFAFAALLACSSTFAQHSIAGFDDGTKISFDVVDSTVDKMNPFRMAAIVQYPTVSIGYLNFNYLSPRHFMGEVNVGIAGEFGVEGFVFFKQKSVMAPVGVSVKEERLNSNTFASYRIKLNENKVSTWAAHIGGFRRDVLDCPTVNWVYPNSGINAPSMFMELAVGVTFIQIHNLKLVVSDQSKSDNKGVHVRQRQKILYAGADLLYYPSAGNGKSIVDTTGFTKADLSPQPPFKFSTVGARLYLKGYGPGWGKNDWGLFYMLAVEECVAGPAYLLGLGLYIGY